MRGKCLVFLLFLGATSCQNISFSGKGNDVPTAGEVTVGVDYGDSFAITEQLAIFHMDYPKAKITPRYLCEVNLLRQLEMDSLRFIIMNRQLSKEEKANLELKDIHVRGAMAAKTSIVLIANLENPSSNISQADLKSILAGNVTQWKDWGNKFINVVFDGGCGSNYEYFKNLWFKSGGMSNKIAGKNTPREVLDYVSKTPGALGFVSLNWIADQSDSASKVWASKVKVLAVENPAKSAFYMPFQSQIAAKEYPFVQEIWMYDLQGHSGLAQGFIAWISSQPGQILMKKSGLIPAHDMGRTIDLSAE
ncbi:MAG: substrate-binding domain-containing protein [Bacteroidia bacterium]|nr:substrate-binding domain-containing protein [Bacteroidia bacterium]